MDEDLRLFLEDFFDFLDDLEALVVKMKQQMVKLAGLRWNPDKIKWEKSQGAKGEFEKSQDFNNPEFKALLRDLALHNGKLSRNGWFYWTYKSGYTVGRKNQRQTLTVPSATRREEDKAK